MTRCAGVGIFLFSFSSLLFLVGFLHSADACERLQKEEVVVRRRERERKRERKRERERVRGK
jgi:hypothetical protein